MSLAGIVICIVLILSILINLFVSMVIFISEDEHVVDHVKIYQLFEAPKYQQLRSYLMEEQYVVL